MKLLSEFGLDKASVTFMRYKDKREVVLCVKGSLEKSDEIAFQVLTSYFKKFIVLHHDEFYEEIANKAKIAGLFHAGDVNDITKEVIMRYFDTYIQKNEIDIICEIEREKSPFYANKYTDLKIQKIA